MRRTLRANLGSLRGIPAVLAILATFALIVPTPVSAQAVSGTILGVVRDSSGAVLPGVTVSLVNAGTGLSRTVVTDSKGEYTAPLLPTGTYNVTAELSGFNKVALSNVHLGVDQKVKVDLKLEVGQLTETVEIQAEVPLLQTSSSDLATTIEGEQIKTLPLNGRNFVSLTRTIPGVLRGNPGSNIDGAGSLAWRASASFSANGQRPRDNNYLLDGIDNNESWLQTVVIFPSVDALDEFKLQTSTYSAEFGRSLGGVVNLQLRSGANEFHGSAFEFYRNDKFDANNWFNNRAGRPKPDFKQHQFGATLGGPIVKDKTFFFADYQGFRVNQGLTHLSTVPSDLMRQGNFSEINRTIYDPLTGRPFPGNIIPQSRWDPVSRNILEQLYPTANTAGSRGATGQPINNYLINPNLERQDNQFDVKIDHNLSQNNRFFIRYSYQKTHRLLPPTLEHGDAGATFGAGDGNIKAQGIAFNDTHTFSPTLLNEFRFGWSQVKFLLTPVDYGTNLAEQMGIPGVNISPVTSAMSQIVFQNGSIRNLGSNGNQPLITNQNDFQIFNSLTKISGRHTWKFGGSVTFRSREILNADIIMGQFGFNQNQTSNCGGQPSPCTVLPNTGFDVASFLLGYSAVKDRRLFDEKTYTETKPEFALYVQDDFRVNSKLTLNMGVRWDIFPPWTEVDDRQSNFDVATGKFVVAADGAVVDGKTVGRYLQTYSKGDIGPRFGFAYDLSGNGTTLIRGGFGIFWNFTPGGTSSSKAQNPPFNQITTLTSTFGTNLPISTGFPPPPGVDPNRPAAGTTRSVFDVDFRDAYAMNWNINVQRALGRNYLLEVAYAGSRGRQMILKTNPNEPRATLGVTNPDTIRPYTLNGQAPALRTVGQVSSAGELDYHGLLVKFQRRFANGFSFLNAYTFAKAIDLNSDNDGEVTVLNVYDAVGYNRAVADYNVKHTLSSSWIYELPFAKASNWGGWQVNGIVYWRTGLPRTITQSQGVRSTGTANRPNTVGDPYPSDQNVNQWYNPAGFQAVAEQTATFGNTGRNTTLGPGQFNIDMSVAKVTRIGKTELELRAEGFNILNHPQFNFPNTQFGNAAFGTITQMLPNPACALCGTTERQLQLSAKFRF
jgi:hypothetical protein